MGLGHTLTLSRLPQAKQRVVMEMLEGFLNQAARTG
jgi:hypothetical protein